MNRLNVTLWSMILFLIFSGCSRNNNVVINMTDYGLKPGSKENAIPAIIKALEECKKHPNAVLKFEKGRYDFRIDPAHTREYSGSGVPNSGPKNLAILIEGFTGLILDGGGSEFIFHGAIQPITVDGSQNITIQNLSIDWDNPLIAQAKVLTVSSKTIDLEIDAQQFPHEIAHGKLFFTGDNWKAEPTDYVEYIAEKRLIAGGTGDDGCIRGDWSKSSFEELKPGTIRMNGEFTRTPALGNYLILRHSKSSHAGIFIQDSKQVKLENIQVFHSAGVGVLSQFSSDLSFKRVKLTPNPAKNRYFSGHGGGIRISDCAGKVDLDECEFGGLMDDPIHVHGTSVRIMEKISEQKLKCRFMREQSTGMNWGHVNDTIAYLENEHMQTLGKGTIKSVAKLSRDEFVLEFNEAVPAGLAAGDALENLSWAPALTVQNCKLNSCRGRGLLVSTPGKVLIDKNEFESSGSAILIAGDANTWYESGAVTNVTISSNTFKGACLSSMYPFCEGIISICPTIPAIDSLKPYHHNITVERNTFMPFDYPVLYAKSVGGIRFNANKIARTTEFQAFHTRKHCLNFEACMNVKVTGNVFEGEILAKDIWLERMDLSQINSAER